MSDLNDELQTRLEEEEALVADGLDEALIGITDRGIAVYSVHEVLRVLQEREGMGIEDAQEFFDYNIAGAYEGEKTPIWVYLRGD